MNRKETNLGNWTYLFDIRALLVDWSILEKYTKFTAPPTFGEVLPSKTVLSITILLLIKSVMSLPTLSC